MTNTIDRAGDSLLAFAEGPGQEAAKKLEEAFAIAGQSIEKALGQAANTGQLDFENMVASVLKDLALLATQSALGGGSGGGGASQTVNLNMNLGQGANAQSVLNARGAITSGLASAVQAGSRFI